MGGGAAASLVGDILGEEAIAEVKTSDDTDTSSRRGAWRWAGRVGDGIAAPGSLWEGVCSGRRGVDSAAEFRGETCGRRARAFGLVTRLHATSGPEQLPEVSNAQAGRLIGRVGFGSFASDWSRQPISAPLGKGWASAHGSLMRQRLV